MPKVRRFDPKVVIGIAAFLGITSLSTLVAKAKRVTWWLAEDAIKAGQAEGLDSLRAWRQEDRQERAEDREARKAMAAKIDTLAARAKRNSDILAEMPEAKAAAKRLRERAREREELFGPRRGLASDHTRGATIQ